MSHHKWATDHRAVVLESIATSPSQATYASVVADAKAIGWTEVRPINEMVRQLVREGLVGRTEEGGFFVTRAGLEYLTTGRFDKAVPIYAPRPGSRKRKGGA